MVAFKGRRPMGGGGGGSSSRPFGGGGSGGGGGRPFGGGSGGGGRPFGGGGKFGKKPKFRKPFKKKPKRRPEVAPPAMDQTGLEALYLKTLMEEATPIVLVLTSGEKIKGLVKYYDKDTFSFSPADGSPKLFVRKDCVKYLYEEPSEEAVEVEVEVEESEEDEEDEEDDEDEEEVEEDEEEEEALVA